MSRHNTQHGSSRANSACTIGAGQYHTLIFREPTQKILHSHHILRRNTISNRHTVFNTGISRFHNGIRSKSRWHKDNTGFCARLLYGFFSGVKNRQAQMSLPTFTRRNTTNYIRAVVDHILRVKGTNFASKTLNNNTGCFVNKNSHLYLQSRFFCDDFITCLYSFFSSFSQSICSNNRQATFCNNATTFFYVSA